VLGLELRTSSHLISEPLWKSAPESSGYQPPDAPPNQSSFSDSRPERLEMGLPGRIGEREGRLLGGPPLGKSQVMANFAAIVSTADRLHAVRHAPQGDFVILSAEMAFRHDRPSSLRCGVRNNWGGSHVASATK